MDRTEADLDKVLNSPLNPNNGVVLAEQLANAEAWGAFVSDRYREAEAELADMRNRCYDSSRATVLEREIALEAMTAPYQKTVDRWKDRSDMLNRRISLGQTLLRNLRAEMESHRVQI